MRRASVHAGRRQRRPYIENRAFGLKPSLVLKKKRVLPPRPAAAALRETDLYPPIRDFLAAQGFTVRGEVHRCDVAAQRGDELVIVELKTRLTLELLAQAVRRQRLTDTVYVAVPRPLVRAAEAKLRELKPLLRRLELGLLIVDLRAAPPVVDIALQPIPTQRRRDPRARRALLVELTARGGDDNPGGSRGRALVTVYRETALFIAAALERFGPLAPKTLRALGAGPKAQSILHSDVYGWFERVDRALYRLRPDGSAALKKFDVVVARVRPRLPDALPVANADAALRGQDTATPAKRANP